MITLAFIIMAALESPMDVPQIAPNVYFLAGVFSPGTQPDGNTIVLRAPDGLVVVDTGRHAEHVQEIVDFARMSKQRVVVIVNTHWHLDHVGGNPVLRQAFPGVRVYASDAIREARTGFLAAYRRQLEEMVSTTTDAPKRDAFRTELGLIDQGAKLEPDEVISRPGKRALAGMPLDVGLESHAVTAGDVWLFEPASRVLIAGDLVTLPAPFLDTACPARWKDSLDRLARVDFKVLVPGHGQPMTRDDFETYRTAFTNLLACGAGASSKDDCIAGWMKDADSLVAEKERPFARSLMDYYVGLLRADPAKIARLCGS